MPSALTSLWEKTKEFSALTSLWEKTKESSALTSLWERPRNLLSLLACGRRPWNVLPFLVSLQNFVSYMFTLLSRNARARSSVSPTLFQEPG
jgi:hypothetical protein